MRATALLAGVAVIFGTASVAHAQDAGSCQLTAADKIANAKLSFDDFDQKGITPSTWRQFENRGCHEVAVAAAEDYLVNGPVLSVSQKQDVLFHVSQSLAMMGRNAEAAYLVAAAIPPDRANHGDLDWTTYLIGTWAFLVGDKPLLDTSSATMAKEPGEPNRIDGAVLRGLSACFGKPYAVAYNECRPKT